MGCDRLFFIIRTRLAWSYRQSRLVRFKRSYLRTNPDYSSTIPHNLFMMFQLMFAILTPALISGAFAERMRFSAFLIFILLWTTLVYNPVAHWVWGVGGWLRELGALDFAGGNVVHITSGVAGLVLAIFLGKRKTSMVLLLTIYHLRC